MLVQIQNVGIRQDDEGRYSLNDIHRAAVDAGKATANHRPGEFLRMSSTAAFVQEVTDAGNHASVVSIRGGLSQGTYADELVALKYAGWINPAFEVEVYRTFRDVRREVVVPTAAPTYSIGEERARIQMMSITAATELLSNIPGVNPGIATACAFSLIESNFGTDMSAAREFLPSREEPACDLNPTQLGKLVGLSGAQTNQALVGLGLQFKNSRREWELTEEGMSFGETKPFARHGHTGYQTLWKSDVTSLITEFVTR